MPQFIDKIGDGIDIGAFKVDNNTRENIANVFSSLSITWVHEPAIRELMFYRDIFKRFYDEECITLFDIFWEKNQGKRPYPHHMGETERGKRCHSGCHKRHNIITQNIWVWAAVFMLDKEIKFNLRCND